MAQSYAEPQPPEDQVENGNAASLEAGDGRCGDCRRTPLVGEWVFLYGDEAVCELCRGRRGDKPSGMVPVRERHGPPGTARLGHAASVAGERGPVPGRDRMPARRGRDRPGERANLAVEVWLTRGCIALTLAALVAFAVLYVPMVRSGGIPAVLYVMLASGLIYGGLVYQVARLAWVRRLRRHSAGARSRQLPVGAIESEGSPAVAILVPSFKEEPAVVRQALMSAALQDHPSRRVVLLIDDPPDPAGADDRASLEAMRALPRELNAELAVPAQEFSAASRSFEERLRTATIDYADEAMAVATLYERAAEWFSDRAARWTVRTHVDRAFVDWILWGPSEQHRATAERLRGRARGNGAFPPDVHELSLHYRRLAWLFDVELSAFERKRFCSLSHRPNKAMNLNSYIALLGKSWHVSGTAHGMQLARAGADEAGWHVQDAEYILTLDADSIVLPDYARTLVAVLERPGNGRTAVAQTPYSAFPGAPGPLERIAGATTDMQYIVHQGFTPHRATYWVGANALLRKAALEDIATCERRDGIEIRKFIQDRTVIEDTESSVDLVSRGWTLYNHPERLAFSATPPDYGALIVQRRRWANGGLLILPRLLRYLIDGPVRGAKLLEGFLRVHYLVSIAATNVGLLVLLLYPLPDSVATAVLPFTALGYFLLYGRDLRRAGYRGLDLPRVYALNLLLVATNLAGVLKSIRQAVTGRRSAFTRTPKVSGRTAAPPLFIVLPCAALVYLCWAAAWDVASGRLLHAALIAGNAALLGYALRTFIGWRAAREDVGAWSARMKARPLLVARGAHGRLAAAAGSPNASRAGTALAGLGAAVILGGLVVAGHHAGRSADGRSVLLASARLEPGFSLPDDRAPIAAAPKALELRLDEARRATAKSTVTVRGHVTPGAGVWVGKRRAQVNGARFRVRVPLTIGTNRFTVTARKPGYPEATERLTIRRSAPPPAAPPRAPARPAAPGSRAPSGPPPTGRRPPLAPAPATPSSPTTTGPPPTTPPPPATTPEEPPISPGPPPQPPPADDPAAESEGALHPPRLRAGPGSPAASSNSSRGSSRVEDHRAGHLTTVTE